mmetsp:Transcript_29213/g.84591  ORF Transcript_29213/g.84591 Transcript_29213/m.84591 type:complete len:132 (+) Transcript_29213:676-1071(+)
MEPHKGSTGTAGTGADENRIGALVGMQPCGNTIPPKCVMLKCDADANGISGIAPCQFCVPTLVADAIGLIGAAQFMVVGDNAACGDIGANDKLDAGGDKRPPVERGNASGAPGDAWKGAPGATARCPAEKA